MEDLDPVVNIAKVLQAYGPYGVIAVLLWVIKALWTDNKLILKQKDELYERVLPLAEGLRLMLK